MERAIKALREFILQDVNAALRRWEDAEVSLPPLDELTCRFGVIDALKQAGDTLCAILPEELTCDEGFICGEARQTASCTVAFWCRGARYEELLLRISRYAACLVSCMERNATLGGRVALARAIKVSYDCDCGVAERQAAACEITVEVRLEEDLDGNFINQKAQNVALLKQGHAREPGVGANQKGNRVYAFAKP